MNQTHDPSVPGRRRPPAHLSASLQHANHPSEAATESALSLHGKPVDEGKHTNGSSNNKSQPVGNMYSESLGYQNWFEKSNNRPSLGLHQGITDEESPNFLPQEVSLAGASGFSRNVNATSSNQQFLPAFMQTKITDSSVDEYRSVIDDLTIENQKLKERLRKMEGSSRSSPQMEKDRLFEVKIHGLPLHKRRELEETLRNFAATLDTSTEKHNIKLPSKHLRHANSGGASHNPALTSTSNSNSQPLDSAYASISNSGPSLTSISNRTGLEQKFGLVKNNATDENVQSFLHNIPKGLLPKHSSFMTERQKKKAVVRRMEQVFTGNIGVSPGVLSQPMQQQEVSKSATRADRDEDGLSSVEGLREARILPYEMDTDISKHGNVNVRDSPTDVFLDQRPTRPLDLDPNRAQIPSDNVEYIRHLGLSTPQLTKEELPGAAAKSDQDWIPLNLLMGMAQLHIMNVTPDFVRLAVKDVSQKFHLSQDGQKVRWRGGMEGTRLSSDSEASSARNQSPGESDSFDDLKKKRRKVDIGRFAAAPIEIPNPIASGGTMESQLFNYIPLFHHRLSSDEGTSSFGESDSLPEKFPGLKSDPGKESRVHQPEGSNFGSSVHQIPKGEGPIIFYNGAPFCTDLSGDRGNTGISHNTTRGLVSGNDHHFPQSAVGSSMKRSYPSSRASLDSSIASRPFKRYLHNQGAQPKKNPRKLFGDNTGEIDFPFAWPADRGNPDQPLQKFSASGLGGTIPADHFAARIETCRTILDSDTRAKLSKFSAPSPAARKFVHSIPMSILGMFQEPQPKDAFRQELPVKIEVVSTKFSHLAPSSLPAPLGYYGANSSSSYSEDDSDSNSSSSTTSDLQKGQYMTQRVRSFSPLSDHPLKSYKAQDLALRVRMDDVEDSDEESDSEDESGIDMLPHADERAAEQQEEEIFGKVSRGRELGNRLVDDNEESGY